SLFGCFYAGVIAVPSYTPINPKTREKLNHVLAESEPNVILKDRTVREGDLASLVPLVPSVDMDEHPVGSQELFADARVGADK
ncbi:hypothetical protein J0689_26945, partial [Vibrio parahaemolyticus]|uniref:hypothetical protein n=1 Tax=Vibrio parahaemolyticus TaxID=670 RepID=UPI001A8CE999